MRARGRARCVETRKEVHKDVPTNGPIKVEEGRETDRLRSPAHRVVVSLLEAIGRDEHRRVERA